MEIKNSKRFLLWLRNLLKRQRRQNALTISVTKGLIRSLETIQLYRCIFEPLLI